MNMATKNPLGFTKILASLVREKERESGRDGKERKIK